MISERQFANLYASFWSNALPFAEGALREMNLCLERLFKPFEARSPSALNGFINELAFRLSEYRHFEDSNDAVINALPAICSATEAYMSRLPRAVIPSSVEEYEVAISDATALAQRLVSALSALSSGCVISFRPVFLGAGVLDSCEGDILVGTELWEVKGGDRKFRQPDIRQLLTYCALNYASHEHIIDGYCLANPRTGNIISGTVNDLTNDVAGCDACTLFDEILYFLCSQDISV